MFVLRVIKSYSKSRINRNIYKNYHISCAIKILFLKVIDVLLDEEVVTISIRPLPIRNLEAVLESPRISVRQTYL